MGGEGEEKGRGLGGRGGGWGEAEEGEGGGQWRRGSQLRAGAAVPSSLSAPLQPSRWVSDWPRLEPVGRGQPSQAGATWGAVARDKGFVMRTCWSRCPLPSSRAPQAQGYSPSRDILPPGQSPDSPTSCRLQPEDGYMSPASSLATCLSPVTQLLYFEKQ